MSDAVFQAGHDKYLLICISCSSNLPLLTVILIVVNTLSVSNYIIIKRVKILTLKKAHMHPWSVVGTEAATAAMPVCIAPPSECA